MIGATKVKGERRTDFMLVEHACLQEKIRHASSDLYQTETIIPLAIGVMYGWVYGGGAVARYLPPLMWWIPVAMVAFGAYRQFLRYKSLWAMHEYVEFIEKEFYGERATSKLMSPYGWEGYWGNRANKFHFEKIFGGRFKISRHAMMRLAFWGALLAITFPLAVQATIVWWSAR